MAEHVCPVWVGYLLASPFRRWFHNPRTILGPHLREGMTVLDVGCAMGFFSIPMARMVGASGRVVAVDMQQRMLDSLVKRAKRAGVLDRIEARICSQTSLGLEQHAGRIDLALAFYLIQETPGPGAVLAVLFQALAPGGRLLVAEPIGHVSADAFEATLTKALEAGLVEVERPAIRRSRTVLLQRPVEAPGSPEGA
jgi:2-polyprenyl-3-methyl-5-hydroxy-6-metoxy-1,4-benzoquinol methylase